MKVEIGVTHQVRINGTDSWVKLSVTEDFPEGADTDESIGYLTRLVNQKVLYVIEDTVETVNNYTKDK